MFALRKIRVYLSADHCPAHDGADSKRDGFAGCKYEFMRARDVNVLLEEPMID